MTEGLRGSMRGAVVLNALGAEVEYDRKGVPVAAALRYVRSTRKRGRRERGIGIVSQSIIRRRARERHAVWLVSLTMRGEACEDAEVGTYFRSVTSYARVAATRSQAALYYSYLQCVRQLKAKQLVPVILRVSDESCLRAIERKESNGITVSTETQQGTN